MKLKAASADEHLIQGTLFVDTNPILVISPFLADFTLSQLQLPFIMQGSQTATSC